jgi:hypothetical protein
MAEVRTDPVTATYCEDIEEVKATAGAFEFFVDRDQKVAGMVYSCPCGCGRTGALNFRPHPSPSWEWNGDREKPNLTPSVHHVGHWHGFLTDGVWRSC